MKLEELFESPIIHNKDLQFEDPIRPFISSDSIKREFEFINRGKTIDGMEYWVVIRKSKASASIGVPGRRPTDQKEGMSVFATVDFKFKTQITGMQSFETRKNVLQVDLVRSSESTKSQGYGFYLYLSLAKAGYVVVSDSTQYIGGKQLWKKIASNVVGSDYSVYVIDKGVVRVDQIGKPIVYTGDNIDESELWSDDSSKKFTLFALRTEIKS